MPPRKRKRPSDQPSPSSTAADDPNNTTLSSSLSAPDDTDSPPFLNTTFTTHRASPLYLGSHPLTQPRLHTLSQRLRDLLVGDVVRGIHVGLDRTDDPVLRRAGALELVSLGWVRLEGLLGRYVAADGDADTSASTVDGLGGSLGKRRALQIALQYENTECVALLLPAIGGHSLEEEGVEGEEQEEQEQSDPEFLHLPLLLLRMPAPLRPVLCEFISRTFDCRISSLSLGTRSLVGALEAWLSESRATMGRTSAKDVVVTLGFYGPTVTAAQESTPKPAASGDHADDEADGTMTTRDTTTVGLKAIDIIIPPAELRRFVRAGHAYEAVRNSNSSSSHRLPSDEDIHGARKRRHLGGDKDEESWMWRYPSVHPQPFMEALAHYLRVHLSLNVFHPAVRVAKIACGGFVLSEGRVKIFGATSSADQDQIGLSDSGQRAVWAVFEGLGARARVKPLPRTLAAGG